mgnify:CR=1 FL=1
MIRGWSDGVSLWVGSTGPVLHECGRPGATSGPTLVPMGEWLIAGNAGLGPVISSL